MVFKLEGEGGVHFYSSSPRTARKLMEEGARLLDKEQAEYLHLLEAAPPVQELLALAPPRPPQR